MVSDTPTNFTRHSRGSTGFAKSILQVLGSMGWSGVVLFTGLLVIAVGIIAIPFLMATPPVITGATVEAAAEFTGEMPHAAAATREQPRTPVKHADDHDVSQIDLSSTYRGSAVKPEAFPRTHISE